MVNWRWTGYNALIYLAAMQAIPRDLYEAAAIDGASALEAVPRITVPLLRPTIMFTVIISTIGGFQLFTEPLLFDSGSSNYQGGSLRQSQTVAMYIFENAFTQVRLRLRLGGRLGALPDHPARRGRQLRRRPPPRRYVGPD